MTEDNAKYYSPSENTSVLKWFLLFYLGGQSGLVLGASIFIEHIKHKHESKKQTHAVGWQWRIASEKQLRSTVQHKWRKGKPSVLARVLP